MRPNNVNLHNDWEKFKIISFRYFLLLLKNVTELFEFSRKNAKNILVQLPLETKRIARPYVHKAEE